ncbi:MAG: fibronectin type III domain-containing protein [Coriobacteriia bacterium]
MASGIFYGSTDNQYISCALVWSATGNAAANTSDVVVTLRLKKSSQSTSDTTGTGYFNLLVDGVTSVPVNLGSITVHNDDVWRDYYSWSLPGVSHGADGTRSMPMTLVNNSPTASYSGLPGTTFTESYVSGTAPFDTLLLAPTAPGTPSLTRVSDAQQNLSWANNAATRAPYAYQVVQRWDKASNIWYDITGALSGAATTYSDTTTAANNEYKYRVRAVNSAGSATSTDSASIYTTPAAATNAVATKVVSDIVITWADNSIAEEGFKVYESQDGGAYSLLATVGAGIETYTHVAPSASVTHAYQVEAYRGSLASARATSNTVVLLTNPLAPTLLAIAAVFDATAAQVLTWQHNPVDGTAQTAYELRYREIGAPTWTDVAKTISVTSSHTFAAATFANNKNYEVQVRTYGQYTVAPEYSPWSASATFATSAVPIATVQVPGDPPSGTVTITIASPGVVTWTTHGLSTGYKLRFSTTGSLPTGLTAATDYWAIRVDADTFQVATTYANAMANIAIATSGTQSGTHTATADRVVTSPSLTVTWAYYDAESTAQTARKVTLYDAAGTTALWTEEVADAATSRVIPYALADGVGYKIGVKLRDGAGLWSVEDVHAVTVDYLEPMTPTLVVTLNETDASATITITNPEPTGGRPIVTENRVYRVVAGVAELVADNVTGNGSCTDPTPVIGGTTGYYVEAYSALPSMAVSATASLVVPAGAYCHFNWGAGYSQHAKLASNLSFGGAVNPDQRYYQFAGAKHATLFTGEARSHAITCSAEIFDDATMEAAFEALADFGGPVIYRDIRGHRVLVGATVKMSEGAGPRITRVDVEMRRISA